MDFIEETISSEEIFNGKVIRLRVDDIKQADGRRSKREIIEHLGGVTIIPVTGQDEVIMVEQFRKPVEDTLLELPAGKLEEGEDPLDCAARELIEETGFQANSIDYLFSFYTSPGFSNEMLHLYRAHDLKEVGNNPDPGELLRVVKVNKEDIIDYIASGKIKDAKTIIGLFTLLRGDL